MFHPAAMIHRQELTTTTSSDRNSGPEDLPNLNSDFGRQRDGPATKLLRQTNSLSENKTLTKLLVHVNVERSLGPVHLILPVEDTVGDLIKAVIDVYLKEKRRPLLAYTDARFFDLHYSQFNFQSLNPEEKLIYLESRNFFLCPKPNNFIRSGDNTFNNSSSSSNDTKMTVHTADIYAHNLPFTCTTLMDFLL